MLESAITLRSRRRSTDPKIKMYTHAVNGEMVYGTLRPGNANVAGMRFNELTELRPALAERRAPSRRRG
jgi:hypothetical protein